MLHRQSKQYLHIHRSWACHSICSRLGTSHIHFQNFCRNFHYTAWEQWGHSHIHQLRSGFFHIPSCTQCSQSSSSISYIYRWLHSKTSLQGKLRLFHMTDRGLDLLLCYMCSRDIFDSHLWFFLLCHFYKFLLGILFPKRLTPGRNSDQEDTHNPEHCRLVLQTQIQLCKQNLCCSICNTFLRDSTLQGKKLIDLLRICYRLWH